MRICKIIIILFFSSKILGQERLFFQNDSIYKLNKVKKVKLFNGNHLSATVFFDKHGRTIKYQGEPVTSGRQKSEYFEYDEKGRLIKQFDVIKDKDKATKIINYEIAYSNEELTKLTKFNPDGSIDSITYYEDKGKKRTHEVYENGKIVNFSISEYLNGVNFNKSLGWTISKNSKKTEFNGEYKYKYIDGKIAQYTRYSNGEEKLTTKFEYYDNNLIKALKYNGVTELYKYKYY